MGNALAEISKAGVAVWLDDLSRERLKSKSLINLIAQDCVVGVTTNPSIFAAAIGHSDLYHIDITKNQASSIEDIIIKLTTDDVRNACDLFRDVFETSSHVDGRVSIEVDPRFARDTKSTISQGRQLWKLVDRPNLLIKVPATLEGLPAITELIAQGISVNVTLIFSVTRYKQVLDAYAQGLARRIAAGDEVKDIFSVASFFVSRIDTVVDAQLPSESPLLGTAAISNAIMAYDTFRNYQQGAVWQELQTKGCNIQRPLWASTGVKNPKYDSTRYVMELVAKNTVNTMPESTLDSVRSGGVFKGDTIMPNLNRAKANIAKLALAGVDLGKISVELEEDGISKFETSWLDLMSSIRQVLAASK